nr:hypothetical protein [Tanacetum cinerariifolium]
MIATPGELDLPVPVLESFHEQIDEELTETDIKQMDANDQAIQTILLGLPEDIYAAVDSCETAKEIWEHVRQMMKGSDIREQEKRQSSSMSGKSSCLLTGNQSNLIIINQQGYNTWQNGGIQVAQNAGQIAGVQSGGNQNGLVVIPGIANQSGTGNVVAARAEGTGIGNQARRSGRDRLDKTPVYDTDGSAEVQLNDNCYDNEIFNMFTHEEQYTDLLEPIPEPQLVPQNDNHVTSVAPSMVQSGGTVETRFAPNEKTRAHQETFYRNLVDQVAQTMHMLNPKPDSFYHPNQKMALGYPNPSYLKKAQLKQQSLYNGNLLLEEHDPPAVYDSEETLELAQERVFVPQTTKSKEELFLSNVSNLVTVSKTISIPNEDLSDDTTPSIARKFLNEVKSSLMTLQRVVKQKMTLEVHNWSSSAHKKSLELEIKRLLKESVSHDIMSIVQNGFVDVPSDLRTELDRTKEKLKLCIIKKEKEYDVLWNNWYTKCEECKYDKISYDKAYNDMQQKVERLQAQLIDHKGKSSDTPSASNTLDLLNQKLESKIMELEFQVVNYEREISHLKTTYKNLFNSIKSNRAHAKLHDLIYENAQLRARGFENTSEPMKNISGMSVTPHVDKPKLSVLTPLYKKLHASMPSHSVPQPREFNVVKHRNVIAPRMFKINPSQTPRVYLVPNKQSSASIRTNPITNSQRHVTIKENVSSNTVITSSTGLVHTAKIRRPQPKGKTRNARVPSASKSSKVKKNVTVEEHRMTLLLSKNQKTKSSECNNIKLAIGNDKSKIVRVNCKQCSVTANHDACLLFSVNALNSRANKLFDLKGKLVASKETNSSNDDKACTSNPLEPMRKQFPNSTLFLGRLSKFVCGTVRFGNEHIAAILGYGDLKWGNITITRVYFVEGGTLASLEIWMVLTCSKAIVLQISTSSISMTWPQLLTYNDLISGLPKFKYAKEHLCPSCEHGKSKRASHPPKSVPNSKQRLHLLHMDLCGPMRVASINGKRTVATNIDQHVALDESLVPSTQRLRIRRSNF